MVWKYHYYKISNIVVEKELTRNAIRAEARFLSVFRTFKKANAASVGDAARARDFARRRAKINVCTLVNANGTDCRRYFERFISINDDTFSASRR